jgi:hypothetical protein
MPTIPKTLVAEYIRRAKPFVETDADRAALRMAVELNAPQTFHLYRKNPRHKLGRESGRGGARRSQIKIPEIHFIADKGAMEAQDWQKQILAEIHKAFCTQSTKYNKYIAEMKNQARVLIGMIAGAVAAKVGAVVAVVGALAASLLAMVCRMGISVFCERFRTKTL